MMKVLPKVKVSPILKINFGLMIEAFIRREYRGANSPKYDAAYKIGQYLTRY